MKHRDLTGRGVRFARDPHVRSLGHRDNVTIWLVDGEQIRDRYVDFTMGGSDARYRFIPRGQVWIEVKLSLRDREATIRHELTERKCMLRGAGYDRAHDRANVVERVWRRGHRRASWRG